MAMRRLFGLGKKDKDKEKGGVGGGGGDDQSIRSPSVLVSNSEKKLTIASTNNGMGTLIGGGSGGGAGAGGASANAAAVIQYQRAQRQLQRTMEEYDQVLFRAIGTTMDRIFPGRRAQEVCVVMNTKSCQIMWFQGSVRGKPGSHLGAVDLHEIREVRVGASAVNTKDFRLAVEGQMIDEKLAICILYGSEFRLKQLCFTARREEDLLAWTEGLYQYTIRENPLFYDFPLALPRWIDRHWQMLDRQQKQVIVTKDVKLWLQRINFKQSPKDIKEQFTLVDKMGSNTIGVESLTELYLNLLETPANLPDITGKIAPAGSIMQLQDLQRFFALIQNDHTVTTAHCELIKSNYALSDRALKVTNFLNYLHSRDNDIWNPRNLTIYQDMRQPLSHYFIASSHNTYLMGDQFRSESSVEAYIRALRDGCRCLEIDTWDGPANDPIVFHGHTMTSKIKFRDVVAAIRDHAWDVSDFPIILSIENHCSPPQQEVLASLFKSAFGDNLITAPLTPGATNYPSPLELLKKIIIKHKKLEAGASEEQFAVQSSSHQEDLSESIMNGVLLIEDKIDHNWVKHFFVLNSSKLTYMEAEEDPVEQEPDAGPQEEGGAQLELHFGEPWFHGDLGPGEARDIATQLIMANNKGDGTFLVRESKNFMYALSFWYHNKVQHCRIRANNGRYFLTDEATFPNLFELVEYFKREPLRTPDYEVLLSYPVPQPAPHEDKKWFHKNLTRGEAEDWLRRFQKDGAFLVRGSETAENSFAISFRAEGKVKHCRIKKEGRMYCIGDADFETLVKLVEYYEKTPLYRKMKLRYAVDKELVDKQGEEETAEDIYHCEELYQEPNAFDKGAAVHGAGNLVTCKAVYDYSTSREDELVFPKDAIITNVIKDEKQPGWWKGDYGGKIQCWFPNNFVEEVQLEKMLEGDDENPLGEHKKAELDLRFVEAKPRGASGPRPWVFRVMNVNDPKSAIDVAAETEEEMMAWVNAITTATLEQSKANVKTDQLSKKLGIHRDLSDLIFYSQSVGFAGFDRNPKEYYKMSSFMETKAEKQFRQNAKEFSAYHQRFLSRVYPSGRRLDSSNFDPQPMWNVGAQMVALNYQHYDKPLWLNSALFQQNGRTGYLLKPEFMRNASSNFDPYDVRNLHQDQLVLTIRIISARHLIKPNRGIASPFVEVEIVGVEEDICKFKTPVVPDNGLCPIWNEEMSFNISVPELASVRFIVQDEDMFGDPNTIGQACYPLGGRDFLAIRNGYRSVQLRNVFNEPLDMSSLLVHIDATYKPKNDEYQSLQDLRSQLRGAQLHRDEIVSSLASGRIDASKSEELKQSKMRVLELEQRVLKMKTGTKVRTGGRK